MAHVATTALRDLWFDASRIVMVVPGTAGRGATVHGIADGAVEVVEMPAALLQRLGIDLQFARLTRPDGSPVLLRATSVAWLRAPFQAEHPSPVRSVVSLGSRVQGVTEPVETVLDALRQAGAQL